MARNIEMNGGTCFRCIHKKIMIVGQALNLLDRGWFVFETYPHTHRGEEREREREREKVRVRVRVSE